MRYGCDRRSQSSRRNLFYRGFNTVFAITERERTDAVMQQIAEIAKKVPGVDQVVTVSDISILDNMATLANAGVAFVVLSDWDARLRQKGQDLLSINQNPNRSLQAVTQAIVFALLPPPIQASATSAASRCRSRSGTAISTTGCCRA